MAIDTTREIVQDEFDKSYWLLDVEEDKDMPRAKDNDTVSRSFSYQLLPNATGYRPQHVPSQEICSMISWTARLHVHQMMNFNTIFQLMLRMSRTVLCGGMSDVRRFRACHAWRAITLQFLVSC